MGAVRRERDATGLAAAVLVAAGLAAAGCGERREAPTRPAEAAERADYPAHWWAAAPEAEAAAWEILPQRAGPGEVILSKRNELGLLSNFAATPFTFRGRRYASLEGFWQMMKYPEGPADPRATWPGVTWAHTREGVGQMTGHEAKAAGDLGTQNMKAMGIDWVTFEGRRMTYRTAEKGEHYALIVEATREKVRQNPQVKRVLLATGDLVLRPDHNQEADAPPAWRYHEIMMMIREEMKKAGWRMDRKERRWLGDERTRRSELGNGGGSSHGWDRGRFCVA